MHIRSHDKGELPSYNAHITNPNVSILPSLNNGGSAAHLHGFPIMLGTLGFANHLTWVSRRCLWNRMFPGNIGYHFYNINIIIYVHSTMYITCICIYSIYIYIICMFEFSWLTVHCFSMSTPTSLQLREPFLTPNPGHCVNVDVKVHWRHLFWQPGWNKISKVHCH